MTNILNIPLIRRPSLTHVLWHISWPFFLFSLVLLALLTLSWTLLLPRFASIDVGGALRSSDEIRTYHQNLTAQISMKEEGRRQRMLAVHDPQYDALKEERRARMPLDEIRTALTEHAKAVTGRDDAVAFSGFDYDPEEKTLVLTGDIRNVDTRSMTVLAQFALSVKDLSWITEASMPLFTREEDPTTGLHSPFSITLTLQ